MSKNKKNNNKYICYDSLVDYVIKGYSFEKVTQIYKDLWIAHPHLLFAMYHNIKNELETSKNRKMFWID